jgi:hypothetical protein
MKGSLTATMLMLCFLAAARITKLSRSVNQVGANEENEREREGEKIQMSKRSKLSIEFDAS